MQIRHREYRFRRHRRHLAGCPPRKQQNLVRLSRAAFQVKHRFSGRGCFQPGPFARWHHPPAREQRVEDVGAVSRLVGDPDGDYAVVGQGARDWETEEVVRGEA